MKIKKVLITVLSLLFVTNFGCAANEKENLAASCLKDFKSRIVDPASLELRGDVVYDHYTKVETANPNDTESHEYIFCSVGYRDEYGIMTPDIILYKDGEYMGTLLESYKITDKLSNSSLEDQRKCLLATAEYYAFMAEDYSGVGLEGTSAEYKYNRDIKKLSGSNVAKAASVNFVKMN